MSLVVSTTITVKSPAFDHNGNIPVKYSCNGENINPEIIIKDIPSGVKSLALVVTDPDAPGGFVHWVMWNIPVTEKIAENSAPGIQGKNGRDENKYHGPCPPNGTHHYHFYVYALDKKLDLPESSTKSALLNAIEGHILGSGEIIGLFKK